MGKQTARYHQSHVKKPSLHRIRLDVDAIAIDGDVCPLLLRFQRWDESFEKLERLLQDQQTLKLTYEDDIAGDPKIAYQQICVHLGLEPVDVHIRYGKTNPFPIKDMIINCSDVEKALSNTGYDWMLHG
jgi:hypothetical protein